PKKADTHGKKIRLPPISMPEMLSIKPDVKYYDIKEGLFNRFKTTDLSTLNQEAKAHILAKIPESGLFDTARREALDAVHMIESMVQAIGWTLDYTALEIQHKDLLDKK